MKKGSIILILLFFFKLLYGQESSELTTDKDKLGLSDVILLARQRSPDAFLARHQFLVAYWTYRSFKAELLPSLNLGVVLPEFNHSLVSLQDAETGEYNYVQSYYMRNSLTLSVDQNIAATGGKLSFYTSLERLDQYKPLRYHTYSAQPASITYTQPIFGNFNTFRWNKKIEPEKYEKAKYEYLEAMEDITIHATDLFFNLLLMTRSLEQSRGNYQNTQALFQIAQKRYAIGAVTKNELMQLEVNLLDAKMEIQKNEIEVKLARFNLSTFLGLPEREFKLVLPEIVPELRMNVDSIYQLSMENTSVKRDMITLRLEAERAVALAKANRGISADLFLQFGLNQSDRNIEGSYRNLKDRENVQLGIRLPVLDWGMGKGRVKTARSQQDVIDIQLQQYMIRLRQDALIGVLQFNNQAEQCTVSARADSLAAARYQLSVELFSKGKLSVLELNTAQAEKDRANTRYFSEVADFWKYYYQLQRNTLYDFLQQRNINADFDLLIRN